MSVGLGNAGEMRVTSRWTSTPISQAAAKFVRLAQLRKLRGSEQVAAICFRARKGKIEFLLVRTRGGRWTFPKGSAEPGLTHAQAAALEAFEEAGVHGRMEEVSFARYVRRKGSEERDSAGVVELIVNAHLCEVTWLEPPQETGRKPTWFSAEKAMRRLRDNRGSNHGAELARMVDLAMIRILRLAGRTRALAPTPKVRCIDDGRESARAAKRNGRSSFSSDRPSAR